MLSSEGKLTDNDEVDLHRPLAIPHAEEPESGALREPPSSREQIFSLIDRFLSLEACLHHQIVPLGLKDNKLLVGVVNPHDKEALNYVSRILAYINCTMVAKPIASSIHRTILSAYLREKNTSSSNSLQKPQSKVESRSENQVVTIMDDEQSSATTLGEFDQELTFVEEQADVVLPIDSQTDLLPIINPNNTSGNTNVSSTLQGKVTDTPKVRLSSNLDTASMEIPDILTPLDVLATLTPRKLLEELLARVLLGGIGRLYLERQHDQGRILWSDNGVLQSVIENLPISIFQEVINELKLFADLPITTLAEPKQVEKELVYQHNSLLLRLRIMPGLYGEEATLQVLRGAALKFYQQQQLNHLSHDTLLMTQQLKLKLRELEQRLLLNTNLQSDQLQAVVALSHLVENLDKHLTILNSDNQQPKNIK
ncbi:pilus assembly protein PilB [Tolypothrix sp. PCC 7910]|uniref:ATPase, T2SS/T4P/T4SS family n=1 Tax=Tolypothrix sp. PCC 7910 TaxID=2099387 RepID=UPI0014279476|nr:pilus assembly protein PilB [Tolypothrix sp. PCC 7910]QIR39284.1 pilus assembly protein PilB [Tolypothrix sp. PCC 7910]